MGNQRCGADELSPVSPAHMGTGAFAGVQGDLANNP